MSRFLQSCCVKTIEDYAIYCGTKTDALICKECECQLRRYGDGKWENSEPDVTVPELTKPEVKRIPISELKMPPAKAVDQEEQPVCTGGTFAQKDIRIDLLVKEVTALQERNDNQVKDLERIRREYGNIVSVYNDKIDTLSDRIKELEKDNARLGARIVELDEGYEELNDDLDTEKLMHSKCKKELERVRHQLDCNEKMLDTREKYWITRNRDLKAALRMQSGELERKQDCINKQAELIKKIHNQLFTGKNLEENTTPPNQPDPNPFVFFVVKGGASLVLGSELQIWDGPFVDARGAFNLCGQRAAENPSGKFDVIEVRIAQLPEYQPVQGKPVAVRFDVDSLIDKITKELCERDRKDLADLANKLLREPPISCVEDCMFEQEVTEPEPE